MHIETHHINDIKIAEIISDTMLIQTADEGLNLLMDLYYQDFDRMMLYERNITPLFFDLKNGLAGEILQKFSNYRVHLAIVGDFSKYTSKSITDFMYESNKGKQVNFVASKDAALAMLANH